MYRFPIVIEKCSENFSAYCPDLLGCVATGCTVDNVLENMRSAIQFHIDGLKKEGLSIPKPATKIQYIEISI